MSGVWLLLGPESGEKDAFVDRTVAAVRKGAGSEPEIHRLYPFDTRMVDLVALLRNRSLFATQRVVILSNVEAVKGQGEALLLADYCASPSPDATLILRSTGLTGDISSRITKAVPKERQKIFWEMFEGRKAEWVRNFFRKRSLEIDQDAVELILEMVENNTQSLQIECGRLADFFASEGRVGIEQVQTWLTHSREENVFSLFDCLAERDFEGCQEVLDKILLARESDPVALLPGLLWQVRRLHALHLLLEQNYSPEEALAKLSIRSRKSQHTYLEARRLYPRPDVERLIVLIADADRRIRTGRSETHRLTLELFLYKATRKGAAVRASS